MRCIERTDNFTILHYFLHWQEHNIFRLTPNIPPRQPTNASFRLLVITTLAVCVRKRY
jgi:hypothetical protein